MAELEPSDPSSGHPLKRLESTPSIDDLLPRTPINHLLSESEAQLADLALREFEALGAARNTALSMHALYPVFYERARELVAAGVRPDQIREEMAEFLDPEDADYSSAVRRAYEDALAHLPPE